MTIPASDIVNVNPGVIGAGGNSLSLNGVFITKNSALPSTGVQQFSNADDVALFFAGGSTSVEANAARIYFNGYTNSTIKPDTIIFAPYFDAAAAGWFQTGSYATIPLNTLKSATGNLTLSVNGTNITGALNFSTITSFSDAATIIQTAFAGTTVVFNAYNSTFRITSNTVGTGGTVTYVSDTLPAAIHATYVTGTLTSAGTAVSTPASAMDNVKVSTQNWATFSVLFTCDLTAKQAFTAWSGAQNQRYLYVCTDNDSGAITPNNAATFGALAKVAKSDGVVINYAPAGFDISSFICGTVASIDFTRANGRITSAFKFQAGLTPTATTQAVANALLGNGYNFIGSYATANDQFTFYNNGQVPSVWKFVDSYVNQIQLNSQFQLVLMNLFVGTNSIPYNEQGYALIRASLQGPIDDALNFGSIRTGVALSDAQKAQVNQAAGRDVASLIETQGYYLQILDPGAAVRAVRGSPVINFWYADGGAVQKITMASIDIL